MEENIMDEQTTNNIIKQKEEEDISRWEKEQLEKLILGSIKFAEQMGLSRKQYKRIVFKLWTDESSPKEEDEIIFRKKARHFLIRNREAFYKIEENLQYYEDIFYLMYMLLKKDCYLKRTDLEREYEKHGYEKKFENYFISQKILNSLRDTFYDKLVVDKTGKVEVKRNDDEFPIKDNEKFKKFQSKYGVKSGVIGFTAIKIIWAVEQEEL